jgi:hypothetical protein
MQIELRPVHQYLDFMSPLSRQRADELARFVANQVGETVVDIGCGWAALLIRILEKASTTRGLGIDVPRAAQGAVCVGSSQVWSQHAEANMPLNYAAALTALRKLVAVGFPVVYGEAIWRVAPTLAWRTCACWPSSPTRTGLTFK